MTPIIFDTTWLYESLLNTNESLGIKLREYLKEMRRTVPYTPAPGMMVSLSAFLDSSFSTADIDYLDRHNFKIEEVCMLPDQAFNTIQLAVPAGSICSNYRTSRVINKNNEYSSGNKVVNSQWHYASFGSTKAFKRDT